MDATKLKNVVTAKTRELSEAREELEKAKSQLADFELAIETLEQPALVAVGVGVTPTETMNQIIGDAASVEEKKNRLAFAKDAAEKYYSNLVLMQRSISRLEIDLNHWKEQLDWAENYESLAPSLKAEWAQDTTIIQRIKRNKNLIEEIRSAIAQRKNRISNWDAERAKIIRGLNQQGMSLRMLNENIPQELAEQNAADSAHIESLNQMILDDEFQLEKDFRQFVRNQVAREKALKELRDDFQQLEDAVQNYRAVAENLQAKLLEFPVLSDLTIPLPQDFDY